MSDSKEVDIIPQQVPENSRSHDVIETAVSDENRRQEKVDDILLKNEIRRRSFKRWYGVR